MKIDEEDKHLIEGRNVWYKNGYAFVTINGSAVAVHHLVNGFPPAGMETDHKNRDRLDNRRDNLRIVTRQQNVLNRRSWAKSGYRNAYLDENFSRRSKPYKSEIRFNGKKYRLGYFKTAKEASEAAAKLREQKMHEAGLEVIK